MAEPIATALDPAPTSGPDQSSPRRLHPRTTAGVLLAVAVVVLAWAVVAGPLRHTSSADTTSMTPAMGTATVVRTDVAERQQVAGTLGYAGSLTVVGQQSGTVTAVAAPGRVVGPGGKLAEVDGTAIVMMLGQRPAWRSFAVGMSDGPDVRQLETSLRALGFDPAHAMTIDDHFSFASAAAVRRWQQSLGAPQSGVITLGSVVFLPTPIRVTEDQVLLGALTGPGQPLLAGTTTDHEVSVALDAGRQSLVHVGDQVVVTLPDGTTTTKGVVTFVSRVATGGGSVAGNGNTAPTVQVTVALADQSAAGHLDQAPVQVAITDQLHTAVLAVPVTALLAAPGGGYAITRPDGTDVPVTVGLFDDLTQLVEVSGPGVTAGMSIQVPKT